MTAIQPTYKPTSAGEVAALVRETTGKLLPVGGRTKTNLSRRTDAPAQPIDMTGLTGVVEYAPTEFTITVLSGTTLSEIDQLLSQSGQYLPFDPPLAKQGATIGGTIAAGLSGPSRLYYGGARDFMLGVRFVDGVGNQVTGGGKVVKNAAGFDFPKLFVGSRGELGIMTELTLKVFPSPETFRTLRVSFGNLADALSAMQVCVTRGLDIAALDLTPQGIMEVRVCGPAVATARSIEQLRSWIASGVAADVLEPGADEYELWAGRRDADWLSAGMALIKVPLSPHQLLGFDSAIAKTGVSRQYSVAGNVAWLGWPSDRPITELDRLLTMLKLGAVCLMGQDLPIRLGWNPSEAFARRIRGAIDPDGRLHV